MKNGSCSPTTVAGSAALPFVISTGGVMGLRPTQGDEKRSCSATTVAGSAALPFGISTGGVMGLRPTQGDEKRVLFRNYCCWERRPPLWHLDRRLMGLRPTQGDEKRSCSATTVAGSAALPFVISTGAPKERSGEICGVRGPFLGTLFDRAGANGRSAYFRVELVKKPRLPRRGDSPGAILEDSVRWASRRPQILTGCPT
jgi:hypothetical protein